MLAAVDFNSPLLWAVFVGWVLSVVLHEFAHGLVAWWGGDYTIRERGGLTLNPLQYVDPMMSIILPMVIFLMGGIPLPGGVTYVRRDLLRSRAWQSAVSAAGPVMNFLIFLACALPFHPAIGWLDPPLPGQTPTTAQTFLGAMATLELFSVLLNLVPVPPLDGFQMITPWMKEDSREKLMRPPASVVLFLVFFFVVMQIPHVIQAFYNAIDWIMSRLGFDDASIHFFGRSFNLALFGIA
jgi:Zn-dependent protease